VLAEESWKGDGPRMKPRMATIRDVARQAEVSIASVSAVLNGTARVSKELEERVRRAVADLGYAPHRSARSLRQGRSMMLSLIVPDIANPFFGTIARIVEQEADNRGYALLLSNTGEDPVKEQRYLQLARQSVDGIILAIAGPRQTLTGDAGRSLGVPTVLIDRDVPELGLECVATDNRLASRLAISHLLDLGHRRIGAILGPSLLTSAAERAEGFHATIEASDADRSPELVQHGDFHLGDGYRKARALLALKPMPTAIFASNNLMAIGAMRAIGEAGLVCPRDISLIGIDDFEWATAFYPHLTTVSQPMELIGRRALLRLMALLAGGEPALPRRELLPPALIVRESCAPPADAAPRSRSVAAEEIRR
jgi:LacI family transcriptional regulator